MLGKGLLKATSVSSLARGTWIEMPVRSLALYAYERRPSQEGRGLKFETACKEAQAAYGRPSQEGRGLKSVHGRPHRLAAGVVPRKRDVD